MSFHRMPQALGPKGRQRARDRLLWTPENPKLLELQLTKVSALVTSTEPYTWGWGYVL